MGYQWDWYSTDFYGLGHSEEVVTRALAAWSGPRPLVFTKCTMVWDDAGNIDYPDSKKSIRAEVEASLRRLQIDVIDLYQMHWPDDDLAGSLEAWTVMAELKKEGKVRHLSVSNFDVAELSAAAEIAPVISLQPPYSLLSRDIETEMFPHCLAHDIGVINYSPMGSGIFSGAMTRERIASLPSNDWRNNSPNFQEPRLTEHLAIADRLTDVGARHGQSAGATAIAWTLRQPVVTGAIVGARSPAQVEGFIGALNYRLTPAEITYIESGT
ncbi:MAG: aldo/keto reductase [Candidatus Synoicihabitans palmerolidicus]|nr:aldo/keto reductase [Candidatus Synoicihabitans palmerolidicus]